MRLYARSGVPEYWTVNIQKRVLEVFRQPTRRRAFAQKTTVVETETITPLAAPVSTIAVAELLP